MRIGKIPTSTLNEQELAEVRSHLSSTYDMLVSLSNEAETLIRISCRNARELILYPKDNEKARQSIEELRRVEEKVDNLRIQSKLELLERALKNGTIEDTMVDQVELHNMIAAKINLLLEIDSITIPVTKELKVLFDTGNRELANMKEQQADEIKSLLEVQKKYDEEISELKKNLAS
jgi:hypothetical protein